MPQKGRTQQLEKIVQTLNKLPRRQGQVLVGGKRTLDIYIHEGKQYFKRQCRNGNWDSFLF